ncbi:T9SS type A sorting domain-containing protein [Parabacteroides sp.]
MNIKSNILYILLALLWMPVHSWAQDLVTPGEKPDDPTIDVAKIGENGYPTLAEAFGAATDGTEIILQTNFTQQEAVTVSKNNTLNLNALTLTGEEVDAENKAGFINTDAQLTIKNGTLNGQFSVTNPENLFAGADVSLGQTMIREEGKELLYRVLVQNGTDETPTEFTRGLETLNNSYSTSDKIYCFWLPASQAAQAITCQINGKTYTTAPITIASHSSEILTLTEASDDPSGPDGPDDPDNPNGPYTITYNTPVGGTLTVSDERNTVTSGNTVEKNTILTIKVKPSSSYYKLALLLIGTEDYTAKGSSGQITYQVTSDTQIIALFFNTNTNSGGGGGGTIIYPDCPTCPDAPDYNFDENFSSDFKEWMDKHYPGWSEWWSGNTTKDYTVLVRKTGLGTITPGTTGANKGQNITFNIQPAQGQQIVDVRINGNSVGAVSKYELKNIRSNTIVDAVFSNIAVPVYTLTSKVINPKEGSVTPTCVRVTEGSNHDFNFYPNGKNCVIIDVQTGPKKATEEEQEKALTSIGTPEKYIFTDVKADSVVVVTFDCPTAIEAINVPDYMIYTEDKAVVVNPDNQQGNVKIYSISGMLIYSQTINSTTHISLPEGVYVVALTIGDKPYIKKISL